MNRTYEMNDDELNMAVGGTYYVYDWSEDKWEEYETQSEVTERTHELMINGSNFIVSSVKPECL